MILKLCFCLSCSVSIHWRSYVSERRLSHFLPSFSFPFSYSPSRPFHLEVCGPLNPAKGRGERCKLYQWVLGQSPAEIEFGVCLPLKLFFGGNNFNDFIERKKRKRTCIAPIVSISTTKRSDVDHTELPANTPHLPFLRISIR